MICTDLDQEIYGHPKLIQVWCWLTVTRSFPESPWEMSIKENLKLTKTCFKRHLQPKMANKTFELWQKIRYANDYNKSRVRDSIPKALVCVSFIWIFIYFYDFYPFFSFHFYITNKLSCQLVQWESTIVLILVKDNPRTSEDHPWIN